MIETSLNQQLYQSKTLVPVIVLERLQDAVPLAQAVEAAGGQFIEITLRTPVASEAIATIKQACPNLLVAAGTVLSVEDVETAVNAGADFLIAPGLDSEVIAFAQSRQQLMIPGVATPSEALLARKLGLKIVKFFPAEVAGGTAMLKALGAVCPELKFMPTGGVNQTNLADYAALSNVGMIGGTWVADKQMIAEQQFERISEQLQAGLQLFN